MRRLTITLVLLGIAMTPVGAAAQVHLSTARDGSRVIYNVPGTSTAKSRRAPDYQWLSRQRDRASDYDAIIARHASRYGVDPVLVKAVITVESNFNPATVSHKGARGLMQLMPATGAQYGVKFASLHDPEENIRGGIAYLARHQKLFPGDLRRILAAYNAGEGAVTRHGGIPPYSETQTYVAKALTVYYGRPMAAGSPVRPGDFPRKGKLNGGFKAASAPVVVTAPAVSLAAQVGAGGTGRRR